MSFLMDQPTNLKFTNLNFQYVSMGTTGHQPTFRGGVLHVNHPGMITFQAMGGQVNPQMACLRMKGFWDDVFGGRQTGY